MSNDGPASKRVRTEEPAAAQQGAGEATAAGRHHHRPTQFENLRAKLVPVPVGAGPAAGTTKRIAIVGGGIAGVSCAWQLLQDPLKRFEVTLFEAEDYLGGAVRTRVFKSPEGNDVVVDTAVVFTEENFYPNLYQLIQQPGIGPVPTEQVELGSTATFLDPATGEPQVWSNVWKGLPLRDEFKEEANRFMLTLQELQGEQDPITLFGMTAGQWIKKHNFSDEFVQKAVIPMLLTFAITRNGLLDVPLAILHIYFGGGALQFVTGSYGRRATYGWSQYMDRMRVLLGPAAKLSCPVSAITRRADPSQGVDITYSTALDPVVVTENFDEVVVCILKDKAMELMGSSATLAERLLFSRIGYEEMIVYAHNDPNVLSTGLIDGDGYWRYSYFNYRYEGSDFGDYVRGATTYVPLHDPDHPTKEVQLPLLTYANAQPFPGVVLPRPEYILDTKKWRHVTQSVPGMLAGLELSKLNGKDRVWYAGNDVAINFHEGALCTGLVIAKALGVDYPFKDQFKANWVFNLFDQYMMNGMPPYELTQLNPH